MFTIRDIIEALNISAKKFAIKFGYTEKEIQDILDEKRKMSKIEFLAFCKFTNISDDFFNGSKHASTQEERRIVNFIANKKAKEEIYNKEVAFKKAVSSCGYEITDEEIKTYYNANSNKISASIVKADKPNLLLAIYKAFPSLIVEGEFFNSEYHTSGKGTTLQDLREKIIRVYTENWRTKGCTNKFSDSDIVYFAEPSNDWLMLFCRGYFVWDNKKVLYLINNGAKYGAFFGTEARYENTYPVFGEDVAITLLIKEYCEKHLK